jgi:formamidopyrimidine-DNA glycosylase
VVLRTPAQHFRESLPGDAFTSVGRRGKFLLFELESGRVMVANAMLTGRFAYVPTDEKRKGKLCWVIGFENGWDMRYADDRLMGKVYLVDAKDLDAVPRFKEMGPGILDPALTEDEFVKRSKRFRGQVKSMLVDDTFVAGIGNAYSDEILWEAQIHPYVKRTALSEEDIRRLYQACHSVIAWATPIVEEKMKDRLDYEERRDHLRVHRRGDQACPRCGNRISEVTAGQRITSFCRYCQPDGKTLAS